MKADRTADTAGVGASGTPPPVSHKKCTKCGEDKPLDMYYRRAAAADGRTSRCIECCRTACREGAARRRLDPEVREAHRAYAANAYKVNKLDPEWVLVQRKRVLASNRAARERNRTWVDEHKVSEGCCVCGYSAFPQGLALHHIDPATKGANISRMAQTGSLERVKKEVALCRTVCHNCHLVAHSLEHNGMTFDEACGYIHSTLKAKGYKVN